MTLPEERGKTVDSDRAASSSGQAAELLEGLDYYLEDGLLVFTATFLRKRGYCCESGCRHCPYQNPNVTTESL